MSNISCIDFNRLIEQAVESRTPVDSAALRGHATECAGCRAAWLDALLLDGAVAEWRGTGKKILPSVDLADIVLARRTSGVEPIVSADDVPFAPPATALPSGTPQDAETGKDDRAVAATRAPSARPKFTRTRSIQRIAVPAVVVAAVVAAAFFWSRTGQHNQIALVPEFAVVPQTERVAPDQTQIRTPATLTASSQHRTAAVPPSTARQVAVVSAPVESPVEAPVEAMVQGAQSAYLDLANQAAQAVAGATTFVRPSLASAMAPVRDENDRWVDDVGHQFEPVGKNLSEAFQFIFEAVPADKAPAT